MLFIIFLVLFCRLNSLDLLFQKYLTLFRRFVIVKEKVFFGRSEWPHQLMTLLTPLFELCILGLNVFSIVVLVWGVCLAGKDFIKSERQNQSRFTLTKMNTFIKNFLGSYILLSLEILIAADIIESIVKLTFQDILKLATLVIIRTVISYFLHKEIEYTMTDMEQQEKEPDTPKT